MRNENGYIPEASDIPCPRVHSRAHEERPNILKDTGKTKKYLNPWNQWYH